MGRSRGPVGLAAVLLGASLAGCPDHGTPPPPPTDLTLAWMSFDQLLVGWTPPPVPVDAYVAEGRVDSGPFELIADDIPGDAIGGTISIDPAMPELVVIGLRLRAVRGGLPSGWTPEATLLRGLRPPAGLVVHAQGEDVALSWTQASAAAEAVRVERAVWDFGQYRLGPYQVVATLPRTATSFLDTTTAAPFVAYGYRLTNLATHQGAPVVSAAAEQMADATTALTPPTGLSAALTAAGVLLGWTPASRNATAQLVERSPAEADAFATIATLDAAATSWLDPTRAAGGYRYRVSVTMAPGLFGLASSSEVAVHIAPPPGPWGLAQEVLHVPAADGVARDAGGGWWFARHWIAGGPVPFDTGVFAPAPGGWALHRLGGTGGEYLVEPGLLLDPAGRPHVLWLKNVDPTPTTSPRLELRHAWWDGATWGDEPVAARAFDSGNLGYDAQAVVDAVGALHVIWEATEISGSTASRVREYATNARGSWSVVPVPLATLDQLNALTFRVGVAPDESVHVVALGTLLATSQATLVHSRLLADGSWSDEVVPAGALAYFDTFRLVARGAEEVDLLYTSQPNGLLPAEYRFLARTAAGWGSAAALGQEFLGSGHLLPSLSVSPDGSRRAALLALTDGLALATWEAGTGWANEVIHPTVPFDVPWLAFDGGGALDVLVPGGVVGADGYVDRIHLRSTR